MSESIRYVYLGQLDPRKDRKYFEIATEIMTKYGGLGGDKFTADIAIELKDFILAFKGKEPAAVLWFSARKNELMIMKTAVVPKFRRQKLATKLHYRLVSMAARRQIPVVSSFWPDVRTIEKMIRKMNASPRKVYEKDPLTGKRVVVGYYENPRKNVPRDLGEKIYLSDLALKRARRRRR